MKSWHDLSARLSFVARGRSLRIQRAFTPREIDSACPYASDILILELPDLVSRFASLIIVPPS